MGRLADNELTVVDKTGKSAAIPRAELIDNGSNATLRERLVVGRSMKLACIASDSEADATAGSHIVGQERHELLQKIGAIGHLIVEEPIDSGMGRVAEQRVGQTVAGCMIVGAAEHISVVGLEVGERSGSSGRVRQRAIVVEIEFDREQCFSHGDKRRDSNGKDGGWLTCGERSDSVTRQRPAVEVGATSRVGKDESIHAVGSQKAAITGRQNHKIAIVKAAIDRRVEVRDGIMIVESGEIGIIDIETTKAARPVGTEKDPVIEKERRQFVGGGIERGTQIKDRPKVRAIEGDGEEVEAAESVGAVGGKEEEGGAVGKSGHRRLRRRKTVDVDWSRQPPGAGPSAMTAGHGIECTKRERVVEVADGEKKDIVAGIEGSIAHVEAAIDRETVGDAAARWVALSVDGSLAQLKTIG